MFPKCSFAISSSFASFKSLRVLNSGHAQERKTHDSESLVMYENNFGAMLVPFQVRK